MANVSNKPKRPIRHRRSAATVIHANDGKNRHVVGIGALRVLLTDDGTGWFAQGLEIDYAAAGNTQDEAKKNFEAGLSETIKEHLLLHGNIDKLMQIAPQQAWSDLLECAAKGGLKRFFTVQAFDLAPEVKEKLTNETFPFSEIAFMNPDMAAA